MKSIIFNFYLLIYNHFQVFIGTNNNTNEDINTNNNN